MAWRHPLLTPVDAAWFRMDARRSPADIAAVMLFDGALDEAAFREAFERRVLVHERFRSRVVDSHSRLAPPHWAPEQHFSLDAHIHRRTVAGGEAALVAVVEDLLDAPFDRARSPWNITVLDGLPTGTALLVRLHHCLGDGFALLDVLLSLARDEAPREPGAQDDTRDEARDAAATWVEKAMRAGREGAAITAAAGHLLALSFDPPNALRGRVSGKLRVAWTPPIPLERVRTIAKREGVTINDVIMAALSGAFRRVMLDERGEAPDVRAIVPVNLRPKGMPIDLHHGNWFGLVFAELGTDRRSREARLAAMRSTMNRLKGSKEPIAALAILMLLGRVPKAVDRLAEAIFGRKASVVVTNVPGPRARLAIAGTPLRDLFFWVPHPAGLACGASVLSYAGTVRVGIRSDDAVLRDPARLARYFEEELASWS